MTLSREAIEAAATASVQRSGLSSLSMRAVANALGVAPGALYWHVASKQELLALVAEAILAAEPFANGTGPGDRPQSAEELARRLRHNLLAVRDGAEIVSFALALHPDRPVPVQNFRAALALPTDNESDWAARTLVHFVLGTVAEQQNRAELARAGITTGDQGAPVPRDSDAEAAFSYGVDTILRGIASQTQPSSPSAAGSEPR